MGRIAILTSLFFQKTAELDGQDRIIFGGAERYLVELCKLLRDEGHEVTVYQAWRGEQVIQKEYAGIPFVLIPTADDWSFHTGPNLNPAFNDLALGFDLRIYFATFLCWPEVRRPAISICHGIWWDFPQSPYGRFSKPEREEWFRRHLYGFTAPDVCVAVDTNSRNFVAALEPGAETRIHVIPNFVDTEKFRPREEPRDWERIRVLFPRRMAPLRGANDILLTASEMPDLDFILCGQVHDQEAEAMLDGYLQQGKAPNVTAEWHEMHEMPEVYKRADIAVIPTRGAEGTSLSCLEAMASGLPIVATPVGGLSDLVINNFNGFVVDLNHGRLLPAIRKLAEDAKLRELFGRRNREMAVSAFGLDRWRSRWRRVLRQVMKEGKARNAAATRNNEQHGKAVPHRTGSVV